MAIDTLKITHAIMEGSKIRDEKGIIPLFGVYLCLFFTSYYNNVSFDFLARMGKRRVEEAEKLLIGAAQECGYATFHGIRQSWEWEELIQPMLETVDDQIKGFLAVAAAFGWGGEMEVMELVPGEKLHFRVHESYESAGYLKRRGIADSGKCFMLRGVAAAFMDLLYGEAYPDGCFAFSAKEPSCRAKGDPFCEFIAEKSST
jgi:predicted hydrocarbon binding protein